MMQSVTSKTAQCGSKLSECPESAASILAAFVEAKVSMLEPFERHFNVKEWRYMGSVAVINCVHSLACRAWCGKRR